MFGSQDNQDPVTPSGGDPVSESPVGAVDPGTSSDPAGVGVAAMPDLNTITTGVSTEPTLSEAMEALKRIEETLARIEAKSGGSV